MAEVALRNAIDELAELPADQADQKALLDKELTELAVSYARVVRANQPPPVAQPVPQNVQQLAPIVFNDKSSKEEKRVKVTHDGEIESFPVFMVRFKKRWAGVSDEKKVEQLLDAVASKDMGHIANSDWDEAEKYLKKTYQSVRAMQTYFNEKFGKMKVVSDEDLAGLAKLRAALQLASEVVKGCEDIDVAKTLFEMVYSRLPDTNRKHAAMRFCGGKRDNAKLVEYLEQEEDVLFNHQQCNKVVPATPKERATPTGGSNNNNKVEKGLAPREDNRDKPGHCKFCGEPGHFIADCPKLAKTPCRECGTLGSTGPPFCKSVKCVGVNKSDVAKYFPPKSRTKTVEVATVQQSRRRDAELPRCFVLMDGIEFVAIIDTASKVTLFPEDKITKDAPPMSFAMADGKSLLWTRGPCDVDFQLCGRSFNHPVYGHKSREAILGVDFLRKYGAVVSLVDDSLNFTEPPKSGEAERDNSIGLAPETIKTKAMQGEVVTPKEESFKEKCTEMVQQEFPDLMQGLGKTDLVEHCLDTGDHEPIAVPNRRMAVHLMGRMAEHLSGLLGDDVIEESDGEWSSPLVPIEKKDGDLRAAIDYRALNAICKKKAFPMPRIDEVLETLGEAKLFSRLDLRKGYYQIMLREEDRVKTAFAFKGKLYHFKRMPFGLTSAPQTFQRLMKKILGDLPFVVCYLDDVLIFSLTEEEHMQHVRIVLDLIRAANLKLNADKCEFGADEVEFLGFEVKDGSKTPNDEKSAIMRNFPKPKTRKQLKGFLGLANFYREFIPDFAQLAQPLFDACGLKKFAWSDEGERSFERLKEVLSAKPCTYLPDLNVPFILTTDASGTGMGAVLAQDVNGERKIIEFMSHQFKGAELRYSTIEKEATAIWMALQKWECFLKGSEFVVESDHKPLHWLLTKRGLPDKLGRMAMKLMEYPIKGIEYIKGEDNLLADTLSRIEICAIHSIPGSPSEKLKKLLEKDPKRFLMINGRVYLVERESKRLCIDTEAEKRQILSAVHEQAGHFGFYKCSQEIRQKFYWPSWKSDLRLHLKRCEECATTKDDIEPHLEELAPLESEEVWERGHLDLWVVSKESEGNTLVAVLQDAFSKWLEAKALPDARAATIIAWLRDDVFTRFGEPDMLTTDGGTQFNCKEFAEFLKGLKVSHHIGGPYHHKGNGLVERGIQTIEKMVRPSIDKQEEWSGVLPRLVRAYNEKKHFTTGVTPHSLMFNREARTKLDREFELERIELDPVINVSIARINKAAAVQRMKKQYDKKLRPSNLEPDQLVLWHVEEQGRGKSRKLNRRWQGPFRVVRVDKPNVTLADDNGKLKRVHLNHVKRIHYNKALALFRSRGRPRILRGRCSGPLGCP